MKLEHTHEREGRYGMDIREKWTLKTTKRTLEVRVLEKSTFVTTKRVPLDEAPEYVVEGMARSAESRINELENAIEELNE